MLNNLKCHLKLPKVPNSFTSISLNLKVPVNNYAKCYFPGFKISVFNLQVTAKLINKGINLVNYPTNPNNYGSVYKTTSASYNFVAGSIPNSAVIDENPKIYDGTNSVTIG